MSERSAENEVVQPDRLGALGRAVDAARRGGIVVCWAKCESCQWGQHDGGVHDWAGPEDVVHAKATGQPDPTGQPCGCYCTNEPPRAPEEPDFEAISPDICDLCGEVGACAYDAEGRPLIHAEEASDD